MRTTTAARLGAAFTAAAVALSLGAGTATAEDSSVQTEHLKEAPSTGEASATPFTGAARTAGGSSARASSDATIATAGPGAADLTSFSQKSIILAAPGYFIYEGTPVVDSVGDVYSVYTHLTVNGLDKGLRELAFASPDPYLNGTGIILKSSTTSAGKARLGPSVITYEDEIDPTKASTTIPQTQDPTIGGYFYIRRNTKTIATYGFEIFRSGSTVKFKANSWKIFQQSSGKYVGIGSIKLQYKRSDGSWATLKTMSLNIYGSGSYSITTNTKRRYRLLIPTNATTWGSRTTTSPLI